MLAGSVGLPYFVLSATSPLVQTWMAAGAGKQFPYRLFALSNAASLAALVAYPLAIGTVFATARGDGWWRGAYAGLLCLLGAAAVRQLRSGAPTGQRPARDGERNPWLWIALAACASTLWLAVANYLGQQVAAMPFLWVAADDGVPAELHFVLRGGWLVQPGAVPLADAGGVGGDLLAALPGKFGGRIEMGDPAFHRGAVYLLHVLPWRAGRAASRRRARDWRSFT